MSEAQRATFQALWRRALAAAPSTRRPAVGMSPLGVMQLGWSFADLDAVLTIDIAPDGSVDWYFHDRRSGRTDGTVEHPEPEMPESAFWHLVLNFSDQRGAP